MDKTLPGAAIYVYQILRFSAGLFGWMGRVAGRPHDCVLYVFKICKIAGVVEERIVYRLPFPVYG